LPKSPRDTTRQKMRREDRRAQLLACAEALFFQEGYEQTGVEDIMAMAGVSKGGFYHHFDSKDEVLEAVAARLAEAAAFSVRDVLDDPSLSAVERLNAVLTRSRRMKRDNAKVLLAAFEGAFRPDNIVLYYRLHRAVAAVMTPVFTAIIEQGRAEGTFTVADAKVAAEILLHLGTMTHDAVADAIEARGTARAREAARALETRLRMQGMAFDRILGLPDGTVELVEPGFVTALLGG
jgi:AcrR family transcriptional regulator